MIFREIQITNKKPLKIQVPESWDDVTFEQFRLTQKEDDPLKRGSILTGIPVDYFNKYPELADFYVWLEGKLYWSTEWDEDNSKGEVFVLDNEVFNFPKDVGVLSIGLYKDIQSEAQENKDNILDIYPLICASYYQLLKDGEYDYLKAKGYIDMFDKQPCTKVYNAAGFFLNKVNELRNGTIRKPKNLITRMIRSLLVSIGFQRYSGLKLSQLN